MNTLNVITNVDWFSNSTISHTKLNAKELICHNIVDYLKGVKQYINYDLAIINIGANELLLLCLVKWLSPQCHLKIISVDLILSKPETFKEYVISKFKTLLLKKVDYFVLYMKDSDGYQKYYGINKDKIKYIPFKINSYEYVKLKKPEDKDYILTGGVSKRDYKTLFEAVKGLPYKIIVLSPPNSISTVHGTKICLTDIPENISIVHDDGSAESWVDFIAEAKFIVLPIKENTISPTGISTYILAMALKKCVIVSEGPATREIIPCGAAIVVPPENANILREAIIMVHEDTSLREKTANEGYKYATTLKDHERLIDDIINFVSDVVQK